MAQQPSLTNTDDVSLAVPPPNLSGDLNSSTKFTTIQLNGENYQSWARSAYISLVYRGKVGYVNGEIKSPKEQTGTNFKEWDMQDKFVLSLLLNSLEPAIYNLFIYSENAKELWDSLKEMYGNQHNYSHIFKLKQEINQITQKGESLIEIAGQLKRKWDELNIYQPPTVDPVEIRKRNEQEKVFRFLSTLDSSYEAARSQILLASDLPSFSSVLATLQREETRRKTMNREEEGSIENSAMAVHQNKPVAGDNRGRGRNGKQLPRCTHCNRNGHDKGSCWFLHPHLRPSNLKKNGGNGGDSLVLTGGERERVVSNSTAKAASSTPILSSSDGEKFSFSALKSLLQRFGQEEKSGSGKEKEAYFGYSHGEEDW